MRDIAAGKMVIVTDDADRENEGDLVMAAEKATPKAINFMAMHGRGLICVPISNERAEQLGLRRMVAAYFACEQRTAAHARSDRDLLSALPLLEKAVVVG